MLLAKDCWLKMSETLDDQWVKTWKSVTDENWIRNYGKDREEWNVCEICNCAYYQTKAELQKLELPNA